MAGEIDQSEPQLVTADVIAPMDAGLPQVLKNAGIVVAGGRIVAVGERSDLRRRYGELPALRSHFSGILTPGLVNAHTHLELSYQSRGTDAPGHFTKWVSGLMRSYPAAEDLDRVISEAVRKGAAESLAAGVTTVGDISRQSRISRRTLAGQALRAVSFGEVVGLGRMRERLAGLLEAATDREFQTGRLSVGISPHAPYTVEGPSLRSVVRRAIVKRTSVQMHLAEVAEETAFLRDLSGPLGREWDVMSKAELLDEQIPLYGGGPVRWAQLHGLLLADKGHVRDFAVALAHVNYVDDAELDQLAASSASVVYCPRTHAFFGHQPHRYRDMLDAGINVCLGTDSLASNPDLSVLREAQLLGERDGLDPYQALEMITWRGAAAIGLEHEAGSLSPQKAADFAVFEAGSVEELIKSAPVATAVFVDGQSVK